jgi:hypothetical protein
LFFQFSHVPQSQNLHLRSISRCQHCRRLGCLPHCVNHPSTERAVTRTGPKRHSDVTHELRDTTYRAEGLAARRRQSGILASVLGLCENSLESRTLTTVPRIERRNRK